MTIEQLKEKHNQTSDFFNDNGIEQETIDHANISIQFAIAKLFECLNGKFGYIDIEHKIKELILLRDGK
jgi:hypothetical protein